MILSQRQPFPARAFPSSCPVRGLSPRPTALHCAGPPATRSHALGKRSAISTLCCASINMIPCFGKTLSHLYIVLGLQQHDPMLWENAQPSLHCAGPPATRSHALGKRSAPWSHVPLGAKAARHTPPQTALHAGAHASRKPAERPVRDSTFTAVGRLGRASG